VSPSFPDHAWVLAFLSLVAIVVAIYAARVVVHGAPTYDRVERIGGSALLSKSIVNGWYWAMQPLARAFVALGISANAVSWMSLVLGAASGVAMAYGRFGLGAVLGVFGCLFDAVDGLVARLSGKASDSGEVLDAAIDRYTELFFLGGLIVHYRDNVLVLVVALFALLGSFMISYSTAKAEAMQVTPPRGMMRRHERSAYLLVGAGLASLGSAYVEPLARMPSVRGVPMVLALAVVAVVANVSAVRRFAAIAASLRHRAKEPPAPVDTADPELSLTEVRPR
jgi:CDP-diacylglycerol---glycerol-3-phosphate 3-phosphatidyltransferase